MIGRPRELRRVTLDATRAGEGAAAQVSALRSCDRPRAVGVACANGRGLVGRRFRQFF